jgi:hypothetical protein
MTKVEEIEKAIAKLPRDELTEFRAWFDAFEAQIFDAAIEEDIAAGKLDRLAEEAVAEHKKGRSREL